jgi:hypothetical protein
VSVRRVARRSTSRPAIRCSSHIQLVRSASNQ